MKSRPWPIVILAWIHLLSPIGNVLVSAHLMHVSLYSYYNLVIRQTSLFDNVNFFLLFPVAAFAIYACKSWSYPIFLSVASWSFYQNFMSWRHFPLLMTPATLVAVYAVNIAVVGYFLIPSVRAPYFNPRLRWWESKPRYTIDIEVEVDGKAGVITNISEGGAFLKTARKLSVGEDVRVQSRFYGLPLEFFGKVVYSRPGDARGYGIQFHDLAQSAKRNLKRLCRAFYLMRVERRPDYTRWYQSFGIWVSQLVRTGKGWVPEIPESFDTRNSPTPRPKKVA